jgi:Ni/Co efflux regulator RcnB
MTAFCKTSTLSILALALIFSSGAAVAQDHHDDHHDNNQRDSHHDNHQYVRHNEWHKGGRINHDDWNRGDHVDYREAHLRAPRRGYEWRQVDGNYVEAAIATGVILSVIAASAAH